MLFELQHVIGTAIVALGGGAGITRAVSGWATKRANRKARLEEKRLEAESAEKIAAKQAEAQVAVAETTGKFNTAAANQAYGEMLIKQLIEQLRVESADRKAMWAQLQENREELQECREQHEQSREERHSLRTQLTDIEGRASAMQEIFEANLRESKICTEEREKDRKRIAKLEAEVARKVTPPKGVPASR